MQWMRERLNKDEGFTLVELMVVVLIIAILIAIAIPTFLGARRGAQDRAAQAQIRNALVAEKAFFVDNNTYTETAADVTALEPNLTIDGAGLTGVALQLNAADSDVVCLTMRSESGNWYRIWESAAAGTGYDSDTTGAAANPFAACEAVGAGNTIPAAYTAAGW